MRMPVMNIRIPSRKSRSNLIAESPFIKEKVSGFLNNFKLNSYYLNITHGGNGPIQSIFGATLILIPGPYGEQCDPGQSIFGDALTPDNNSIVMPATARSIASPIINNIFALIKMLYLN